MFFAYEIESQEAVEENLQLLVEHFIYQFWASTIYHIISFLLY